MIVKELMKYKIKTSDKPYLELFQIKEEKGII